MKRSLLALPAVLALTACGSSHKVNATAAEKQQGKAAVAAFDAAANKCLPKRDGAPNVFVLKSHQGRHNFGECAVPARKRVKFNRCATKVFLGGLPTPRRIKVGVGNCLVTIEH